MRNLTAHPITIDEIVSCLREQAKALSDDALRTGRFGDMRPLLLQEAAKIINRVGFAVCDVAPSKTGKRERGSGDDASSST